ncbi:MAG: hypothetical protein VB142_06000 [Burkholderia sp.]
MVHERHALEGRSDEGRRPHMIRSHFDGIVAWPPDASDQRLAGSHQRTLPGYQAKDAQRLYTNPTTMRTVLFLSAGKLDFSKINPHVSRNPLTFQKSQKS